VFARFSSQNALSLDKNNHRCLNYFNALKLLKIFMHLSNNLKNEIIIKLAPLNPEKVILFGSYAWGEPTKDSDIDLYVVTQDDFIPETWKEKNNIHLTVANAIKDIIKKYPTDLITHTKKMHEKFAMLNSSFYRKLMKDGVVLYG